jgi:hypothetical protein
VTNLIQQKQKSHPHEGQTDSVRGTISAFTWSDWVKPQITSVRISSLLYKIQTRRFQDLLIVYPQNSMKYC